MSQQRGNPIANQRDTRFRRTGSRREGMVAALRNRRARPAHRARRRRRRGHRPVLHAAVRPAAGSYGPPRRRTPWNTPQASPVPVDRSSIAGHTSAESAAPHRSPHMNVPAEERRALFRPDGLFVRIAPFHGATLRPPCRSHGLPRWPSFLVRSPGGTRGRCTEGVNDAG